MRKYLLYPHGGSGNHGCEAIVRGTRKLLDGEMYLYSSAIEQDKKVNLEEICQLYSDRILLKKGSLPHLKASLDYHVKKQKDAYDMVAYKEMLDHADEDTIALSIGGDNYCYGVPKLYLFLNEQVRKRGAKTVLWGCSVEPEAIKGEMKEDLAKFDLITARETISFEALKKVNENTILCADPAFILDTKKFPLPEGFEEGNMVGINVSPLIMERESASGITEKNYKALIKYILEETSYGIALIPHVCWPNNDDRKPLQKLYDDYKDSGRIVFIEEHNCEEQKGYIARCRFFVGARTHATIAAYSSYVPTLVVGYSVKAKGIARDLFDTEENYVIPVQSLEKEMDLKNAFCWIEERETEIKAHLQKKMPDYRKRVYEAKKAVENL